MAAEVWLDVWRRAVVVRKRFGPAATAPADRWPRPPSPGGSGRCDAGGRWLSSARHHPVVELCHVDPVESVLTTRFAGAATVACAPPAPAEAAMLLGAVATALGAMHREGLVHGNLAAEHIVINGPRFELCSPSGSADDPADDVAAFGRLMDRLINGWDGAGVRRSELQPWRELALVAADGSLSAARLGARLAGMSEHRPVFRRRT